MRVDVGLPRDVVVFASEGFGGVVDVGGLAQRWYTRRKKAFGGGIIYSTSHHSRNKVTQTPRQWACCSPVTAQMQTQTKA
jgi:hypothetical protein